MNHFVKSFWLGALFSPPCWKCALKHCPFMVLVIIIPLFLGLGLTQSAVILTISWGIGMFLFLVIPRNRFKLKEANQTLYFFCYDIHNNWKNITDENRPALMRVFIKENGKLKNVGRPIEIRGFDTSLLHLGFFLAKKPYAEWILFGNGFDSHGKPLVLGRKMADYVFLSTSKSSPLRFIHGKAVIDEYFEGVQKFDTVFYDPTLTTYKEIAPSQDCTSPAETAGDKKGCFIFIKRKDIYLLYKVINETICPAVYEVQTNMFMFSSAKNAKQRAYFRYADKGYTETSNWRFS